MNELITQLQNIGIQWNSIGFWFCSGSISLLTLLLVFLLLKKRKISQYLEDCEADLLNLEEDNNQTHQELELSLNALKDKNKNISQFKEKYESASLKNNKLKEQLNQYQSNQAGLEHENESIKSEINKLNEANESSLNASKMIIANKENEINSSKADLIKLNESISSLQDKLKKEISENEQALAKWQESQISLQKKNIEFQNLQNTKEELQNYKTQTEEALLNKQVEEQERLENENKNKRINELINIIYSCFNDIDHTIFKCYHDPEVKGTYLHVNQVSNLSFNAAEAIGSNPQLAKASALFHDLGKTSIFKYFKENWHHNKNQKLETENSSFTFYHRGDRICSHIERGVQIFNEITAQMPQDVYEKLIESGANEDEIIESYAIAKNEIKKSILEHQAKSQVRMLYNEALKNGEICNMEDFEYKIGQIPSNKEQGIICMADSCEAAFSSSIHESPQAVSKLITQVVSGRINSGHMDNSGLTVADVQTIRESFISYLLEIWESKRPDRLEDNIEIDNEGYGQHESPTDIIDKMVLRFKEQDILKQRNVLRHFVDQEAKILDAINIEDLINLIELELEKEHLDTILATNCIKVLTDFYQYKISLIISDIQKNHPIEFGLSPNTVDQELNLNAEISAYIGGKPSLKEILKRIQKLREVITSSIRKNRLFESFDSYVKNWTTQIDNYLSNQTNIPEPLLALELENRSSKELKNVATLHDDFSGFINVKNDEIYIRIKFDIFRCDLKFLQFNAYFYDENQKEILDLNGTYCTKETKQVAVSQYFMIENNKFQNIDESDIVLPFEELHLNDFDTNLNVCIQIHGLKPDSSPVLMFHQMEAFSLKERKPNFESETQIDIKRIQQSEQ